MAFWRRSPGTGGAPNQKSGAAKGDEENFSTYGQVREAVESEKEIMKLLVDMGEEDFNKLMNASEAYLKARREEQEHERQMAVLQEKKARSEHLKYAEEEHTRRQKQKQEAKVTELKAKGEEMRKNEAKKTDELKKRISYEQQKITEEEQKREMIRLEAKREFERMDSERAKQQEEMEARQFQREMELSKMKIEEKGRLKKEQEIELAPFRLDQALKEHNATKEDKLHHDKELKSMETAAEIEKQRIRMDAALNFFTGDRASERVFHLGTLAVISLAALYAFKAVKPSAEQALKNYFFKPTLVGRSIYYSNTSIAGLYRRAKETIRPPPPLPDVILEPRLQEKMKGVIEATRNTSKRRGLYGHMLLYGKPGTGKTLFAETLARASDMDFAVMSGPSFDQFKPSDAVVEIKKLFKWANRSKTGLLLFVDEADSFLEDRSTLDPARVTVLNEWLNQTGTENRKFMCVYETNRPEVLDPAVQSRITRSIEMTPPSRPELLRMLEQYIDLYVIREVANASRPLNLSGGPVEKVEEKEIEQEREKEGDTDKGKEKEADETFERKEEEEGMKLVGVNDHGHHAKVVRFGLDLPSIAHRLAQEHFVGRDVSNLCIAIAQALYATSSARLNKALVEQIVEEQIHKKRKENIYLKARADRLSAMKKFDINLHV